MNLKELYRIEEIDKKVAQQMVIEKHYLHRKAPCSYAYGLIHNITNEVMGVVMYGVPASRSLQKGVCGEHNAKYVGELTRLWIDDRVRANAESYLIGNTIKKQGFKILVSYAECRAGHVGFVYQATNWIYTGLSAKRTDWHIEGYEGHNRHMFDEYGGINNAKKVLGDKMVKIQRPRKHRYVYLNCGKKEKKYLIKELKYKIEKYPKDTNEE